MLSIQRELDLPDVTDITSIAAMVREDRRIIDGIPFLRSDAFVPEGPGSSVEEVPQENAAELGE